MVVLDIVVTATTITIKRRNSMSASKTTLVAGAVLGGLAVILGAFGAHALESAVTEWELDAAEQAKRLATWETAVRYQMYHALAILAVGLLLRQTTCRKLSATAICFLVGTLIFSGCLYAFTLTGIGVLGAIVPLGGLLLIAGWFMLAWAIWTNSTCGVGSPA